MLLSSGFIVASLGADLKNRRGRRRRWAFSAPPFFFFLLLHSLFIGLSICVCLIEPSWCLVDELIPWLRFWSPFLNKRLHLWIGHMALVGGLWSIHSHFECICISYRASTGQADLPPLSAATWAIFISITHQSSGHLWIPERTHNTHTQSICTSLACVSHCAHRTIQPSLAKSQPLSFPLDHADRVVVAMDTSVVLAALSLGRGEELGLQRCSQVHRCTLLANQWILKCMTFSVNKNYYIQLEHRCLNG